MRQDPSQNEMTSLRQESGRVTISLCIILLLTFRINNTGGINPCDNTFSPAGPSHIQSSRVW